jgi:outer membrane biosynthesis protein TonB
MKNIARTLAVLLLSVATPARAADEPTSKVSPEETVKDSNAPASVPTPSEAPVSAPSAPSTQSESKISEPTPAPKEPAVEMVEPPVKTPTTSTKQPSVYELPTIVVTESKIAQPQDNVTQSVRVLYAGDDHRKERQRDHGHGVRSSEGGVVAAVRYAA